MIERSMMAYMLGAVFMAAELHLGRCPVGARTLHRLEDFFQRLAEGGRFDALVTRFVSLYRHAIDDILAADQVDQADRSR